jgi:hypothetical protein
MENQQNQQSNYFRLNDGKPTTNYKSIDFVTNNKELTEQEIKYFTLRDQNNKIVNLKQD